MRDDIPIGTPVVLYQRQSTEEQVNSQADQHASIGRVVEERKLQVLGIYADEGISGATIDEREDLRRVMVEAGKLGAKAVLVYNTSRLTRGGVAQFWKIIGALEDQGVKLYNCQRRQFVDENDLGSAITASVEAAQAKESNIDHALDISRTMLANVRDRKNAPGAKPPYGFDRLYIDEHGQPFQQVRWEEDGSKTILDPTTLEKRTTLSRTTPHLKVKTHRVVLVPSSRSERVETLRLIFRLARSMGYSAIVDHLNSRGFPGPRGGIWNSGSIRDILFNPAYGGELVYNRTTKSRYVHLKDGQPTKRTERVGREQFKDNPRDEWVVVPDGHEALIPADELDAVRTALALRRHSVVKTGRSPKRVYPLAGIMICGNCGGPMQGMCPDGKYGRYICDTRRKYGKSQCVPCSLTAAKAEAFVMEKMREYFTSDCARDSLRQGLKALHEAQHHAYGDLDVVKREQAEVQREKAALLAKLKATDAVEFFKEEIDRLKEREDRLRRRLSAAKAREGEQVDQAEFIERCLRFYDHHVLQLQGGCENAIRESLRALGTRVIYHPLNKEGGLEIHPFGASANG